MSKKNANYYKQASYKKAKMLAMVRDDFTCRLCGCRRFFDLTTHHLVPVAQGGQNSPVNLVTLCRSCHDGLHQAMDERRRADELLEAAAELLAA